MASGDSSEPSAFNDVDGEGVGASYIHPPGKVGVLLEVTAGKAESAGNEAFREVVKDIALHIAFAKPAALTRDEVAAEDIEKEREAALGVTKAEGKPEAAWDKIVEGRVNKWLSERVLLEQGVFGDKETVEQKIGSGSITRFVQAYIGE